MAGRSVAAGLCLLLAGAGGAIGQQQGPPFRAATELVVIDVNVVQRDGTPVRTLTRDQFEVFIDGRRRAIVSADLVTLDSEGAVAPGGRETGSAPVHSRPRVIVLAIDEASFPPATEQALREAATRVLERVQPDDELGLVAIPSSISVAPTRDRQPIRDAIKAISGARVDAPRSRFRLSAADAMRLVGRAPVDTPEIIARECRSFPPDPVCPDELKSDAAAIAGALEHQGMQTIAGLQGVLETLAALPDRKTLVLISAGLPMSTQAGVRPNFDVETAALARRAGAANVNLYVMYLNIQFLWQFSAARGRAPSALYDDIATFGTGLERLAGASGGAFFQVEVDADPFVDRLLRETSAWYLLAVEAQPSDRDGENHVVRVATRHRGAALRYRQIVNIPIAR